MSNILDSLGTNLATRIKTEREARGWTLAVLAERAGVSKAMVSKIERGETSPTATLLGRLSGAFGLPLSVLLARAEAPDNRLARKAGQPVWHDPETGYFRRTLLATAERPFDMTEIELPAGAEVRFPRAAFAFVRQAIWVLSGKLTFVEGPTTHHLLAGDTLLLGPPEDCAFRNDGPGLCRYLVVLLAR